MVLNSTTGKCNYPNTPTVNDLTTVMIGFEEYMQKYTRIKSSINSWNQFFVEGQAKQPEDKEYLEILNNL